MSRTCSYCTSPPLWLMTQPAANGRPSVLVYTCGRHHSPKTTSQHRTPVDPPVTVGCRHRYPTQADQENGPATSMTDFEDDFVAVVRCPSCKVRAEVVVEYSARLVMDDADSTIRLRLKQNPAPHLCHQLRIDDHVDDQVPGQMRMPDARELAAGGLDLE